MSLKCCKNLILGRGGQALTHPKPPPPNLEGWDFTPPFKNGIFPHFWGDLGLFGGPQPLQGGGQVGLCLCGTPKNGGGDLKIFWGRGFCPSPSTGTPLPHSLLGGVKGCCENLGLKPQIMGSPPYIGGIFGGVCAGLTFSCVFAEGWLC